MRSVKIRDTDGTGGELDVAVADSMHRLVEIFAEKHATLRNDYKKRLTTAIISKLETGTASAAEQAELAELLKGARERIKDPNKEKVSPKDPKEYWARSAIRVSALRRVARYMKKEGLTQNEAVVRVAADYDNPKPVELVNPGKRKPEFHAIDADEYKKYGVSEARIRSWLKHPQPRDPKYVRGPRPK